MPRPRGGSPQPCGLSPLMPLPLCLGHDCSGGTGTTRGNGRSAWGERVVSLDQWEKEQRLLKEELAVFGSDGSPLDVPQQILAVVKGQQAVMHELLQHQVELRRFIERKHLELCKHLDRQPQPQLLPMEVRNADVQECPVPEKPVERTTSRKARTKRMSTGIRSEVLRKENLESSRCRTMLAKIVMHPWFDLIMGLIIVLNLVSIFLQFQWKGMDVAYKLTLKENSGTWPTAEKVFQYFEMVFCAIYLSEFLAHVGLFRLHYFRSVGNVLDSFIVVASSVDAFILTPLHQEQGTFLLARMARISRIFRVLRVVKVLRFMAIFQELRVMISTLYNSVYSLIWSMMLVAVIICAAGVLMVQLTLGFMEDESASPEMRKWVYEQFGNAAKASYTMFEATFTTNWPTKARPLIMEVNPAFSIFWVFYTVIVNFAVMRVIAALFLKQTLSVADADQQRQTMEKMHKKEAFAEQIRLIFQRADQLGDGLLHQWEFDAMIEDAEVLKMFKQLDMDIDEIITLYDILADRDGVADYEEFLAGALKMKNSAPTLDVVQVMHGQLVLSRSFDDLRKDVKKALSLVQVDTTGGLPVSAFTTLSEESADNGHGDANSCGRVPCAIRRSGLSDDSAEQTATVATA